MLTDQEKWDAVSRNDALYDGNFFYGVKTTGVFCRPSCKSKLPRRENVVFFSGAEDARASGLRPCKRCRPDLLEYQPAADLLEQAKKLVETQFADCNKLAEGINRLPVSRIHLVRLFRQNFGVTPAEYANSLRVKKAATCLTDANANVLDIALLSGFGSLSSFYASFKKHFGTTPAEYRRKIISPRIHAESRTE